VTDRGLKWDHEFPVPPHQQMQRVFPYHRRSDYRDFRFWHKADILVALSNVRFRG
jgi:hypothetical protein